MAEENEKTTKVRLDEQAILILAAHNLAQMKPKREDAATAEILERKNFLYKNFCTFRNPSSSGGHVALTKNIFKTEDMSYVLKQMPTSIYSLIVPKIQLYKIFYPNEVSSGLPWRIPFQDVASYSEREISSGTGRFHGVGIKNFRYKYVGTNPAEVNTNIEAELELFFEDIRDLVLTYTTNDFKGNFEGNKDAEKFVGQFSYADLAADVSKNIVDLTNSNKTSNHNEKYYRIKIIVGYSIPDDDYLSSFLTQEETIKLKKVLSASTVALYLTPHNHEISFQEDGSTTLKIKYIAAMTSILASLNVLEISSQYESLKKMEDAYIQFCEQHKTQLETIRKNCGRLKKETVDKKIEDEESAHKRSMENEEKVIEQNKNKIYSELFTRMVGKGDSENDGFLYHILINKKDLGIGTDSLLPQGPSLQTVQQQQQASYENRLKSLELYKSVYGVFDPGRELSSPPSFDKKSSTLEGTKEAITKNQGQRSIIASPLSDGSKIKVKFVFLGDLLDQYAEIINRIPNYSERPRMILTNFNYDLPFYADNKFQSKTVELNIADIPISLDMLKYFLIEKLVRTRTSTYPLLSLIDNIITDVVSSCMSPSLFDEQSALNKHIRISNLTISLPSTPDKNDPLIQKPMSEPFSGIINNVSNDLIYTATNPSNFTNPLCNYCVFYCSNQIPDIIKENKGKYEEDEKDGIFHFHIGTDKGVIKKIDFSRNTTPFYKEAKNASSQGVGGLGRLRETYNTNISMFGNNMYRPGDFLYVEPLIYSSDAAFQLQNVLGIGGYYQVINVETKITEGGGVNTVLNCTFYGHIQNGEVVDANKKC